MDAFYTPIETATQCVQFISSKLPCSLIIEPSAGSGHFIIALKSLFCIAPHLYTPIEAFDIAPQHPDIIKTDFLQSQLSYSSLDSIICIGNPPFGRQSSLAVRFFNHCASLPNVACIAFIVPKSFRKPSVQKRLDISFHLEQEVELISESFYSLSEDTMIHVPCVFQIWIRHEYPRALPIVHVLTSESYRFISYDESYKFPHNVLSFRRVGFYAGQCKWFEENHNKQSHYFIQCGSVNDAKRLMTHINKHQWKHNNTVGARSISKQELIVCINQLYKRHDLS